LAVRLVAPVADSIARGSGQRGVSAESADAGDGTVFGYVNFEDNASGAVSGEGL
jgi:hypothetical protein